MLIILHIQDTLLSRLEVHLGQYGSRFVPFVLLLLSASTSFGFDLFLTGFYLPFLNITASLGNMRVPHSLFDHSKVIHHIALPVAQKACHIAV